MITFLDLVAITVVCFFLVIGFTAWVAITHNPDNESQAKIKDLEERLTTYRKEAYVEPEPEGNFDDMVDRSLLVQKLVKDKVTNRVLSVRLSDKEIKTLIELNKDLDNGK